MEAFSLWGMSAAAFAFAGGLCLGDALYGRMRRTGLRARALVADRADRITLFLRGGVKPLRPVGSGLLRVPVVRAVCNDAVMLLDERGFSTDEAALLSIVVGASMIVCGFGGLLSGSAVFGAALAALLIVGSMVFVRHRSDQQNHAIREKIPETLRSFSTSFRSGRSLMQALSDSAEESEGYLAHLLSVAGRRLEMGAPTDEALAVMRGNRRIPELSFLAVALDVQHQSGGSIAPVLEAASESVEGELQLLRTLKVQTAQAKLSASIVTVMPFALVALFSLLSPDFLSPFFDSLIGIIVLAAALIMQASGVLIVRRMLKVDAE